MCSNMPLSFLSLFNPALRPAAAGWNAQQNNAQAPTSTSGQTGVTQYVGSSQRASAGGSGSRTGTGGLSI